MCVLCNNMNVECEKMKTANYNIRLNPDIKSKAESTFAIFGLNLSEAINIFLHKSILEHGFPFEVKHSPNSETMKAIQEAEDIINGKKKNKVYSTPEDLFTEWAKEDEKRKG